MIASYRDPQYAASIRLEQLQERFGGRSEDIPVEILRVHERRVARSWAGGVAIAGFAAMVLAVLVQLSRSHSGGGYVHPTFVLAGAVVLSLATYVVARLIARWSLPRRVRASFDASGDELSRLARLEEDNVRRAATRIAGEGERASLGLPMVGISLLAPLSIHMLVWLLIGPPVGSSRWVSDFDAWIDFSMVLVIVAHVVLAVLSWRFAKNVSELPLPKLMAKIPMNGWTALLWTFLASFLPGLVALGIPPVIVLLTGVPVVPAMFRVMYRRAIAERQALGLD